jgi:transcriptional regulator with XRE-family HTH domain
MEGFGERLRYYRELSGLSQEQLAVKAGTNSSTVAKIESGRTRSRIDTVKEIVEALNAVLVEPVTMDELLWGSPKVSAGQAEHDLSEVARMRQKRAKRTLPRIAPDQRQRPPA